MLSAPTIAIFSQEHYNNLKGGDALVEAGKLSRVYGVIPDVLDDVAEFTRRHFLAWTVQTIIVWLEPVEAPQDLDEGEVQMTWDLDSFQACYVKLIKACLRRRLQLVIMPSRAESPDQDMQEAIDRAVKEVNASDEFEELAYCMPLSDGYSYGLCGPESNQDFSSTEIVLKTAFALDRGPLAGLEVNIEPEPADEAASGEQRATSSAAADAEEGLGNLVIDEDAADMEIGDEPSGTADEETNEAKQRRANERDTLSAEIARRNDEQTVHP
jgi:hypothetical protein